jgi:hypothetical protein
MQRRAAAHFDAVARADHAVVAVEDDVGFHAGSLIAVTAFICASTCILIFSGADKCPARWLQIL